MIENYLQRKKNTEKRILQQDRLIKINNIKNINNIIKHSTKYIGEQEYPKKAHKPIQLYNCLICGTTEGKKDRIKHYLTYHAHELKEYKIGNR